MSLKSAPIWPLLVVLFGIISSVILFFFDRPKEASYTGQAALSSAIDTDYFLGLDGHGLFSKRDEDYSCTAKRPCSNGACCGISGYCGYNETFCGDGCMSNCNATAECGAYADPPGKECPLNVCCSAFGFCGTTSDFCGPASDGTPCQSNCGSPDVPPGRSSVDVRNNVIGYYESWSASRECHLFPPAAIPVSGLARVNFAFAYIDPQSYKITTMDSKTPESLFKAVTNVKTSSSGSRNVEVYVSLGGWTFSDNETDTQPLLGKIASTDANRKAFANNVLTFLDAYGFDGFDIDWEYPGATDRGGQERDVKNFPLLLKEIKRVLNSSPRKLGLTFTIPSSYWYLRHFDLKALAPYTDTFNMMTYDLHGVWDRDNPIGSIVQAHTNLTEIRLAMDLLWRNDIAPEQVVMGIGFYGRAFQLSSAECQYPGCAFKGASSKGRCTNEGGILGWFEIQDILNDKEQDIEVIHDEEAAVKYFTYNKDQWISYDDAKTFQQKVDYANNIGLAGLLVWAVDMDDNHFTALSGLLGRDDLGSITADDLKKAEELSVDSWASENGQKCRMLDCGESCGKGEMEISRAKSCKEGKPICCPINAAPSCRWRGGESTSLCHGQCHANELTLFYDRNGDGSACTKPGLKAFCCTTQTFTDLINSCSWGGCGKNCSGTTTKVAEKHDPQQCEYPYGGSGPQNRPLCCPADAGINNCHWVGKGTCDDNMCDDNDITLALDEYGEGKHKCALGANDRKKSLCCDAPVDTNPFLPVALSNIFPSPPPSVDIPKWNLILMGNADDKGSTPLAKSPNSQGFGFVLIDGPRSALAGLDKREGSHYHFLDCPSGEQKQTVRIICGSTSPDSNCNDIYEGGVPGTIVKMPAGCGPGTYAVAHELRTAANQTLGAADQAWADSGNPVMELELSYDFSVVHEFKRDAGDIYIRVDYSNDPGYWGDIVNSAGVKKRGLEKRFFSSSASDWASKFDNLQHADRTPFKGNLNEVIMNESNDACTGEAYANIGLTGTVSAESRWGYSFVGTVSPFKIEQAYGFLDSKIDLSSRLTFTVKGGLHSDNASGSVFQPALDVKGFTVPGLVSIVPTLQLGVELQADIDMDAEFYVSIGSSASTTQRTPSTMGKAVGSNSLNAGLLHGEGVNRATEGMLRLSLVPSMNMDITFPVYQGNGFGAINAHERITESNEVYLGIKSDGSSYTTTSGLSKNHVELTSITGSFAPWADDEVGKDVGGEQRSVQVDSSTFEDTATRRLAKRDVPQVVLGGGNSRKVLEDFSILTCSALSIDLGPSPGDDDFCTSPDDFWESYCVAHDEEGSCTEVVGDDGSENDLLVSAKLEKRGKAVPYNIIKKLDLIGLAYGPSSKQLAARPLTKFFAPAYTGALQCTKWGVQAYEYGSPILERFKFDIEHVVDKQIPANWMRYHLGTLGKAQLSLLTQAAARLGKELPVRITSEKFWTTVLTSTWRELGSQNFGGALVQNTLMQTLGSVSNPDVFTFLEKGMNMAKNQQMQLNRVVSPVGAKWKNADLSGKQGILNTIFNLYGYWNEPAVSVLQGQVSNSFAGVIDTFAGYSTEPNVEKLADGWHLFLQLWTEAANTKTQATMLELIDDASKVALEAMKAGNKLAAVDLGILSDMRAEALRLSIALSKALGEFDPAFETRIQFKLFYDAITPEQRKHIWRSLLPIPESGWLWGEDFLQQLGDDYEVNGREIKNMIMTALALAGQVNMSLDKCHLEQVEQLNRNWSEKVQGGGKDSKTI